MHDQLAYIKYIMHYVYIYIYIIYKREGGLSLTNNTVALYNTLRSTRHRSTIFDDPSVVLVSFFNSLCIMNSDGTILQKIVSKVSVPILENC